MLGRCGNGSGSRELSGGAPATSDNSLDDGYTAWAPSARPDGCGRGAATYELATKRTTKWPRSATFPCTVLVRHTKYAVIIGKTAGQDPDDDSSAPDQLYRLAIAPRPR